MIHAFLEGIKESGMQVREWMTRDVITVTPETSLFKAAKLLKEHDIRRLPVIDEQKRLVGIISDRDVKAASPSRATTLEMYELMYLLSEIKVRDVMTAAPVSIHPDQTVETVALLMEEKGIGALPVVDDDNVVIGIITDHDIFKVFVAITGVRHGGLHMAFEVDDTPGTMRPIFDVLRDHKAIVLSMLTSSDEHGGQAKRRLYIRIRPMDPAQEDALLEALSRDFQLVYWGRDGSHA